MTFQISDWVQGKTGKGELIHGFIESMDSLQGTAKVYVVQSDNEEAVGTVAVLREHWLKALPMVSFEETGYFHNLIDLALATRDEAWFKELSEEAVQPQPSAGGIDFTVFPAFTDRLGQYGLK